MGKKIQLRLLISPRMSEQEENQKIRLPKKVRERMGFSNRAVLLGKGDYQVSLQMHKAYGPDVQRLTQMIMEKKLSEEEALSVGFVSRSIHQRLTKREGESIWLSDGIGNITIGCDPEFGLIGNEGFLIRASQVMPHSQESKFGADGPGAEVRPPPSTSHATLVENIQKILRNPPAAARPYGWTGGATYTDRSRVYWFGGHVHLGRPTKLPSEHAVRVYEKIAVALDGLLALPLVAFDTPNANKRRNGCPRHYGKAGDIRYDYPEEDRFEYRVLSGLWLTHPVLAKMVLGVAKCVAETAYNKLADNGFDIEWATAPANRAGLLRSMGISGQRETAAIINNADPRGLNGDLLAAWEHKLRDMDLYTEYKSEVDALVELVKVSPEMVVPQLSLDIKENWYADQQPLLNNAPGPLKKALEALE